MAKIVAPDKGVKQTEVGGYRYTVNKEGVYTVTNPAHIRAMKSEGFFEAALNPYDSKDSQRGYTCVQCGFGSWFLKCSRCGTDNTEAVKKDGE